jgi:hypothetical protein
MHVTHHWPCLCGCGRKIDSSAFDRFLSKNEGFLKCPDHNKWRRVIDSKLPRCKSSETEKAYQTLRGMGLAVNGSHSLFDENDRPVDGMSVICVSIIEDTLEELMKHQKVDGAKYHGYNAQLMHPDCVARLRKEAYDGTEAVPELKCPICEATLIPLHKEE